MFEVNYSVRRFTMSSSLTNFCPACFRPMDSRCRSGCLFLSLVPCPWSSCCCRPARSRSLGVWFRSDGFLLIPHLLKNCCFTKTECTRNASSNTYISRLVKERKEHQWSVTSEENRCPLFGGRHENFVCPAVRSRFRSTHQRSESDRWKMGVAFYLRST